MNESSRIPLYEISLGVSMGCITAAICIVNTEVFLNLHVNSRCPSMEELMESKVSTRLGTSPPKAGQLSHNSLLLKSTSCCAPGLG